MAEHIEHRHPEEVPPPTKAKNEPERDVFGNLVDPDKALAQEEEKRKAEAEEAEKVKGASKSG